MDSFTQFYQMLGKEITTIIHVLPKKINIGNTSQELHYKIVRIISTRT